MVSNPGIRKSDATYIFFGKEGVQPLDLQFHNTDVLVVKLPEVDTANKTLLVTQSHDPYWQVFVDGKQLTNLELRPTSLKFMALKLPAGLHGKTITLQHSWPAWYWPVQWFSFGSVIFTIKFMGHHLHGRICRETSSYSQSSKT